MFGMKDRLRNGFGFLQKFRKKPVDPDSQIPYQVYETVHEPVARRKRWTMRLIAALAIATVVVVGFVLLRQNDDAASNQPGSQAGQSVQQSPQNNPRIQVPAGEPAKTPLSENTNDRTVVRPE